jgi:hypothetical protein
MAINLTALSPITTAATALSNLVLVSPQSTIGYQPQNRPNADGTASTAQPPPAFLFNYEGEQTVTLESDITDHFVEDNTAIQDQIALKPEVVTTHGFVGELNDVVPAALKLLKTAANKLTVIGSYTPQLTTTALIAYSEAFFLYQVASTVADSAVAAWSSITGTGEENIIGGSGLQTSNGSQTKEQVAFQLFYGYWRERRLFTVQTPWAIFQNMAIKSLRAIQDADTRVITDFEVSFKMIRNASTILLTNQTSSVDGQLKSQAAGLADLGTSTPVESTSLLDALTSMLGVA